MILIDELEELFEDLDFDAPTADQTFRMYGIFLKDFHKNPITVFGKEVRINVKPSRHPLFKGKFETFVHIVTRENKYNDKRQFDRARANRIHWIRPILENVGTNGIKFFERINDDGVNQFFFWHAELDFMIILREIQPDFLLLTAFCVDDYAPVSYRRWYQEYLEQKKTPLRK